MTFSSNKTYTFETKAPGILGARFVNALAMASDMTYDMAMRVDNVHVQYRKIFPLLPPGSLDNPKKAKWFLFKTQSGGEVVLCDQWIDLDSIVEVQSINFTVNFTGVESPEMENVRALLIGAGYAGKFTIS